MDKKKQDTYTCCLQDTYFRSKDTHRKWGDGKNIFHANGSERKLG